MAHAEQRRFVEIAARHLDEHFTGCTVLEIGSLDINGSVRDYFHNCKYIGIDVAEGKGVDIVCQAQDYAAPDNTFATVISCEAMEHNPHWEATVLGMVRMCKPGGLVLMTCATTGSAEHGTSRTTKRDSPLTIELGWDYYRNLTPENFQEILAFDTVFSNYRFWTNWSCYDLYFLGIKAGGSEEYAPKWSLLTADVDAYISSQNRCLKSYAKALAAKCLGDSQITVIREFIKSSVLYRLYAKNTG